jgi:hypothetical protein
VGLEVKDCLPEADPDSCVTRVFFPFQLFDAILPPPFAHDARNERNATTIALHDSAAVEATSHFMLSW